MRWSEHSKVRAVRTRSQPVDVAVHAVEGYRRHRTGRNVALISHFGFLSVFPLLLVFTTVLGFVLQSHETLREDIIDSTLAQVPLIGQQISTDPSQLTGSAAVLIIGLLTSLWAGMKAFVAVHIALDDVDETPLDDRSNVVVVRLRALLGICYVGGAQVVTTILATLAGVVSESTINTVLLLIGTTVINMLVLALSYRWLRTASRAWLDIAPGAMVGGVLFAVLQVLGATIVGRAVARASPVYGNFAAVIGLLLWLSLHAMIALGGAELNAALMASRAERIRGGAS
jgi:membrane protein